MDKEERHRRRQYFEEQIARQKRGEPVDVAWIRDELQRIGQDAHEKVATTRRQLRVMVTAMAVAFVLLWIGGRLVETRDPLLVAAAILIAVLAAWALLSQHRNRR